MTRELEPPSAADRIDDYYRRHGSRLIYGGILKGVRHLGYYRPGDHIWQFQKTQRQMEEELALELDLPATATVLDGGSGTGAVATHLAREHGLRVTGVDLLDFNVAQAKIRARRAGVAHQVDFIQGDYSTIDLPQGYFDGAYTMETLVHVPNVEEALARFYDLLRTGGRLVMHEYSHDPEAEMPPKVFAAMTELNRQVIMPGFQAFEHGTLEAMTAGAGFENVQTRDITANITPMMQAFCALMRVPYGLAKMVKTTPYMPNAMTAVEIYQNRQYFRYNITTADKPQKKYS